MARRIVGGTRVGGPVLNTVQSGTLRSEVESLMKGSHYRLWYERFEEFDQATLPSPWATRITGTTPTVAKVANAVDGIWRATLDVTSEAEAAGVDFGDSLMLNVPDALAVNQNPLSRPNFEALVRFPTALTTAQGAVIGLATAYNSTLTSIAEYAWFRLTANMNVLIEGKDGTTTTLAQPTTGVLVAGSTPANFNLFSITLGQGVAIFALDDNVLGSVPMAALANTMKLQPMLLVTKASGITAPQMEIDWCNVQSWRS